MQHLQDVVAVLLALAHTSRQHKVSRAGLKFPSRAWLSKGSY